MRRRRRRVGVCRGGGRPGNKPGRALEGRSDLRRQPRSDGGGLSVPQSRCVSAETSAAMSSCATPWGAPDLILDAYEKNCRRRRPVASDFGGARLFRGCLERPRLSLRGAPRAARARRRRPRRQSTTVAEPGPASHPYRMPLPAHETEASNPRSGAARRRMGSYSERPMKVANTRRTGRDCGRVELIATMLAGVNPFRLAAEGSPE